MCACNHHFYDHESIFASEPLQSKSSHQQQQQREDLKLVTSPNIPSNVPVLPEIADLAYLPKPEMQPESTEKQRRKWFFFF